MPHPRPTGDDDALSSRLRAATAEIHRAAEARPFMRAFFGERLSREAYVGWLARQWHLYRAIEAGLDALPPTAPERGIVPRSLYRAERIRADLDHLSDGSWREEDHRTAATLLYVERIRAAAVVPPTLLAHAWLRYLGNVGGRDVLRRLAACAIGAPEGDERGLAFTDFAAIGDIRPFFERFHEALDALTLDDEEAQRVVAEAITGFRLNIALTDELAEDYGIGADHVPATP